ncbi:TPA: hypothetical protein DIV55_03540 [Patescibacteria group bacterium]|uniref:PEGA domain protein n=1 Tax=Candidatus Gottesmanbacteria bacterium GW2011_GWA1_43_11 TaxID=1618436 RepID=A0A0G1CL16_9BACT|nr:MAG: PEGA domain protein [Candidatus Gottesmanbacteria bacterium GW2011_GWA1_43_11]HCS78793.1 hypothetical protein [Patescibacteria group bacterium]
MKKIILIFAFILILAAGGFFLFRQKSSGSSTGEAMLKVDSSPAAQLFLDNENIGKTPYEDKVAVGEYTLKLIPESTIENAVSWEGRVTIVPNQLTYVNRELRDTELTSGGEILTLEKISGAGGELSVVSTPDSATVTINGEEKGKTPLLLKDLAAGNHELSVVALGSASRSVKIKTTNGYRLNAVFNLAATGTQPIVTNTSPSPEPATSPGTGKASPSPKTSPKASPKASTSPKPSGSTSLTKPPAKPYVEILDTPTGFLRVRAEPGGSGEEVGRVNPGEFYSLLDEESVSSTPWYKIEYETEKEGWISGQYAEKTE